MTNTQHTQTPGTSGLWENQTYLLSETAENWLMQIAHQRFEIKHQLVIHALLAQMANAEQTLNIAPEMQVPFNVESIFSLYMFLHELDFENNIEGHDVLSEEEQHNRLNFLNGRLENIQILLSQQMDANEALEAKCNNLLEQLKAYEKKQQ